MLLFLYRVSPNIVVFVLNCQLLLGGISVETGGLFSLQSLATIGTCQPQSVK